MEVFQIKKLMGFWIGCREPDAFLEKSSCRTKAGLGSVANMGVCGSERPENRGSVTANKIRGAKVTQPFGLTKSPGLTIERCMEGVLCCVSRGLGFMSKEGIKGISPRSFEALGLWWSMICAPTEHDLCPPNHQCQFKRSSAWRSKAGCAK